MAKDVLTNPLFWILEGYKSPSTDITRGNGGEFAVRFEDCLHVDLPIFLALELLLHVFSEEGEVKAIYQVRMRQRHLGK
jgi:hypothetical protein